MAIGDRIRFFRYLRNMSQYDLGKKAGFTDGSARIRIAQYEAGTRTPKENVIKDLANALDVSTEALMAPDIYSYPGLMQTFFALEDLCGLNIDKKDDDYVLHLDISKNNTSKILFSCFSLWFKQYDKYRNGEITKEEYDNWRYKSEFMNEVLESYEPFLELYHTYAKRFEENDIKDE